MVMFGVILMVFVVSVSIFIEMGARAHKGKQREHSRHTSNAVYAWQVIWATIKSES